MKTALHKLFAIFFLISIFSCTKDNPIPAPEPPVVFDRCKGIILGEFDGCGTEFKDELGHTISVEEMLRSINVSSTWSTISFGIEGQQKEFRITPDIKSTKSSVNMRMMLAGKKDVRVRNSGSIPLHAPTISVNNVSSKNLVGLFVVRRF